MNSFLNKDYHVFTDDYYNTVTLTEFLSKKSRYVTGTLRKYRKSNPKEVTTGKPKKGEMVWRAKEDVFVCKWKDTHDALTFKNAYTPQFVTVANHLGKEKQKRNIVRDYNDSVSRIDQTTIEVLQTSRDAHP